MMRPPSLIVLATILSVLIVATAQSQETPVLNLQSPGVLLRGPQLKCDAAFDVIDWNDDGLKDLFLLGTGTVGGSVSFNEGTAEKPRFGHAVTWPFNSTETFPQTIEHVSSYSLCNLHDDGLHGFIFFDGQLRYCPNTGTRHGPFYWKLWQDSPGDLSRFFPGSEKFIAENSRLSTGPESMYWKKGIFPRQVLTLTAADWDEDGLQDLIICRFKQEAPGVRILPGRHSWTAWGRIATQVPPTSGTAEPDPTFLSPLSNPPERGLYFYRNLGTKERPHFDTGVELTTADGHSISAPNPVVIDLDGQGSLSIVSSETPYRCNAFRVDWPTNPHVVIYRRVNPNDPTRLQPATPLLAAGEKIPSGTMARFADLRNAGTQDLLVMHPEGTIRWYPNRASTPDSPIALQSPVELRGRDFLRFEFLYQPLIVDWFGPNSRDLILHGSTDHHCKWDLRRTALYRNVAKTPGEVNYAFVGYLNFNGDPAMVPVQLEERQYDVFGSAMCVFPFQKGGQKQILMSVGGRLYRFSELAEDGLTFRQMTPIALPYESNRRKGWQDIPVDVDQPVQYIRISNDGNGLGNLRDSMLHLLRFEAWNEGQNVAVRGNLSLEMEQPGKHKLPKNAHLMLEPDNAPAGNSLNATSFGYAYGVPLFRLRQPTRLERIRFLLADRESLWYSHLVPFSWQGKVYRAGMEAGENWYHYQVQVSADKQNWITVASHLRNESLYNHPKLIDWDGDGILDLLLGVTSSNGMYPHVKNYHLYRNQGTNKEPRFTDYKPCLDDKGQPLEVRASWMELFSPQCGLAVFDVDGDGRQDLVVEFASMLEYYKNVSTVPGGLNFVRTRQVVRLNRQALNSWSNRHFSVADVDGDNTLDLLDCVMGSLVFYRGASSAAPQRTEDLVINQSDANGVRLSWTRPTGSHAFELRWSTDVPIDELNWHELPHQTANYDAAEGQREEYLLKGLEIGKPVQIALRSLVNNRAVSGISNAVSVVGPPWHRWVIRNGPAEGSHTPEYSGMSAVVLSPSPRKSEPVPGRILEVRSQDSNATKGKECVILMRIENLPDLGKVRSASLEMVLLPQGTPAGISSASISCNAIDREWKPEEVSWQLASKGRPWEPRELETSGRFLSFLKPSFYVGPRQRTWDVTAAVRQAHREDADQLNLLIRFDYTGHYAQNQGLQFCGPSWETIEHRPQLVLVAEP